MVARLFKTVLKFIRLISNFQVTLQLQPMFKRAITFSTSNDSDLAEQAANLGRQHEFADLAWHPGHGEVLYRLDDRVLVNLSGEGEYDFIGFRPLSTAVILANRLAGRYRHFYCLFLFPCYVQLTLA
jgi:hypothetical protein